MGGWGAILWVRVECLSYCSIAASCPCGAQSPASADGLHIPLGVREGRFPPQMM